MINRSCTSLITDELAHVYRAGHIMRWLFQHYPECAYDWHCEGVSHLGEGGISAGGPDIAPDGDDGHFSFACIAYEDRDQETGEVDDEDASLIGYLHNNGHIEGLY